MDIRRKIKKFGLRYYSLRLLEKAGLSKGRAGQLLREYYLGLSEEKYEEELKEWFYWATGKKLRLDPPQLFGEKIQWLKLYDNTPLKTELSDKYAVRKWVSDRIGGEYLVPLYGVWEHFEDIPFEGLPDSFVLKAVHGSGWNIIVADKRKLDRRAAGRKFDRWLSESIGKNVGLELQYENITPRIIAEALLGNGLLPLNDYKIHCFNGVPAFIQVICNRNQEMHTAQEVIYDAGWHRTPYATMFPILQGDIERPACLEQMLHIARELSRPFLYVRVDLYVVDLKIYFGELTFTPGSGITILGEEAERIWGDLMKLPERKAG